MIEILRHSDSNKDMYLDGGIKLPPKETLYNLGNKLVNNRNLVDNLPYDVIKGLFNFINYNWVPYDRILLNNSSKLRSSIIKLMDAENISYSRIISHITVNSVGSRLIVRGENGRYINGWEDLNKITGFTSWKVNKGFKKFCEDYNILREIDLSSRGEKLTILSINPILSVDRNPAIPIVLVPFWREEVKLLLKDKHKLPTIVLKRDIKYVNYNRIRMAILDEYIDRLTINKLDSFYN